MKITPIADKVLLKIDKLTGRKEGNLIVPDASEFQTPTATVVFAGPDCKQLKAGMRVLATQETVARKVRYGGEDLLLVNEINIVGIIDVEPTEEEKSRGCIQIAGL